MSWVRLQMKGFKQFREYLRALPEALTEDAQAIVGAHAYAAATEILAGYRTFEQSGELADGLAVEEAYKTPRYMAIKRIVNRAPHAWWVENGTAVRYTKTGAHRGFVRPHHVFYPAIERQETEMHHRLAMMMIEHELRVRSATGPTRRAA